MKSRFFRPYLILLHIIAIAGTVISGYLILGNGAGWIWLDWTHESYDGEPIPLFGQFTSSSMRIHKAVLNDRPVIQIAEGSTGVLAIVVRPPGSRSEWIFDQSSSTPSIAGEIWTVTIDSYDLSDGPSSLDPILSITDKNGDGICEQGALFRDGIQLYYGVDIWTELSAALDGN